MTKPDFSSPEYRAKLASSLRWDIERDEPYLQLPSFPDLRITPFRPGIEDELVTLFNHPVIGTRLYRLPYPLPRSFAESMVASDLAAHVKLIADTRAAISSFPTDVNEPVVPIRNTHIPGMPLKSIRSVSTGLIVGDIGLSLRKEEDVESTEDISPEEQSWHIGYVLEPAHHGRGIMSEVVGCVLEGWIKPWMGIGCICASVEFNNPASYIALKKNGLELVGRDAESPWPEEKGGGTRDVGHYERRL